MNYPVKNADAVLTIPSFPSFPDDKGTVILLNQQGTIVDEVNYLDDWHFDLLADNEGVSLEKVNPDWPSNEAKSWHSAAGTAGMTKSKELSLA